MMTRFTSTTHNLIYEVSAKLLCVLAVCVIEATPHVL
jgi:hypothetical protein